MKNTGVTLLGAMIKKSACPQALNPNHFKKDLNIFRPLFRKPR